jgi:hypothetical protein
MRIEARFLDVGCILEARKLILVSVELIKGGSIPSTQCCLPFLELD